MKTKFLYLFLLLPYLVRGNMSSPIQQGTMSSTAFSSKDITIVSEKIFVTIAPDGKTARFSIEYNIKSDIEGQQIPLLFYARDFKDSFTVKLDDKSIKLQDTPTKYLEKNMFDGFLSLENQDEEVTIYWGTNVMENTTCRLQELKYFETNIEKGVHKITVTYTAEAWIDRLGWLKKYDFRYSLSPAKYWKSFGTLEINIKQQGEHKQLTTNLGTPIESNNNSQTWLFDKLPAEYFTISYEPSPSKLAAILINIGPFGLSALATIFLAFFHIRYLRKHKSNEKPFWNTIAIFVIPFLGYLAFCYSFPFIDKIIGEEATKRHGYYFAMIIFYPLALGLYWLFCKIFKKV